MSEKDKGDCERLSQSLLSDDVVWEESYVCSSDYPLRLFNLKKTLLRPSNSIVAGSGTHIVSMAT